MNSSTSPSEPPRLDPALVHGRREAVVILIAFAACLAWSVTCCYLTGYQQPSDGQLATVLGIPSWVFWGVLVPWLAADVFACWFCFVFMADDPLGDAEDESADDEPAGAGLDHTSVEGRDD